VPCALGAMEFRILGPLAVRADGEAPAPRARPRAVLAMLTLHAGEPVSVERLALGCGGEEAPAGAVKTIHVHVSGLRKALGDPCVVATTAAGYHLSPCRRRRRAPLRAANRRGARGAGRRRRRGGRRRAARRAVAVARGCHSRSSLGRRSRRPRPRGSRSCSSPRSSCASTPISPSDAARSSSASCSSSRTATGGASACMPSSCSPCTAVGGKWTRSRATKGARDPRRRTRHRAEIRAEEHSTGPCSSTIPRSMAPARP